MNYKIIIKKEMNSIKRMNMEKNAELNFYEKQIEKHKKRVEKLRREIVTINTMLVNFN